MSALLDALARHAARIPGDVAVTGTHRSLEWRALAAGVGQLAGRLCGVQVLGLLADNSPGWIVADLAALQAGCVCVPLPAFFSDAQLRHVLEDARVDTVITDNPVRITRLYPDSVLELLDLAGCSCACIRLPDPPPLRLPAGTAKITYTSGTTGTPRGVFLSRQALEGVAGTLAEVVHADHRDCSCVLMPLSILLENLASVYVPLLAGARIVVPDPEESGMYGSSEIEPARLEAVLRRYRPTALVTTPALLEVLVRLARVSDLPAALRFVAVGGAPVANMLLTRARQLGLPVFQGYGLSEAASVVALNAPQHNRPGSVGRVLPHCRVRISEQGEIHVAGIVGTGYLGEPLRETGAELATGDLGRLDGDGFLYVTGRACNRIVTAFGRNVSPEWIEAELLAHPDILHAVVFGNGLAALAAVLVTRARMRDAQLAEVIDAVNARLPDYARIGRWRRSETPFRVATGELTAAGTVRREIVEQRNRAWLQAAGSRRHG